MCGKRGSNPEKMKIYNFLFFEDSRKILKSKIFILRSQLSYNHHFERANILFLTQNNSTTIFYFQAKKI